MLGILKPTSGEVIYYNLNREDIGYVPQHTYTNSSFPITVLDIVMMETAQNIREIQSLILNTPLLK